MTDQQEWYQFNLPSTPILKCALPEDIVSYLWRRIKVAKDKNIDVKHQLAGNIKEKELG